MDKERVYDLTVTVEIKVMATSEQLAIDHASMVIGETCLKPGNFGAIEVLSWDVE